MSVDIAERFQLKSGRHLWVRNSRRGSDRVAAEGWSFLEKSCIKKRAVLVPTAKRVKVNAFQKM